MLLRPNPSAGDNSPPCISFTPPRKGLIYKNNWNIKMLFLWRVPEKD
jgi:hypothetical protein